MGRSMEEETRDDPQKLAALMDDIRKGDRTAFMTVVRNYQQKVFIMAYAYLKNREDALDIVQETFLRIYQKAETFRPGSNLQGWVLQIGRNLCVDYYRKNLRKRPEQGSALDLENLGLAADPDPGREQAADLKPALTRCVEKLAARQKMVFVLRHYNELPYQEISEALNISVGTVKSLHFKAVQNLRKWLTPYMGMQS